MHFLSADGRGRYDADFFVTKRIDHDGNVLIGFETAGPALKLPPDRLAKPPIGRTAYQNVAGFVPGFLQLPQTVVNERQHFVVIRRIFQNRHKPQPMCSDYDG